MKKEKEFDFSKARKVKPRETRAFKNAIEKTFNISRPLRGRPPKGIDKYKDVHIRLHPKVLEWARSQAKHRGIGYQTLINEILMSRASRGHGHI
ncbi:MAG: BrnA antitoxin family protein [Elusimicrobiales bacterium]|nr:BrnA antitoxin family protein [Elusimicrobiales bacterium]MCK5357145.1 BrnA antitoxin family protein [Elusimicrobiales bacterium]